MHCEIVDHIYLKADGSFVCGCTRGDTIPLFSPKDHPDGFDYVSDCYNGEPYIKLRETFAEGKLKFQLCKACNHFSATKTNQIKYQPNNYRNITLLNIESSFLCNVNCDGCIKNEYRNDPLKSPLKDGPYILPVDLFKKLIDNLTQHKISVERFLFCGKGEPLLHPNFTELLTYARKFFPDSFFSVHTNGNINFSTGLLLLDELVIAIDGVDQNSYSQYRQGGKFDRVIQLARDAVQARNNAKPQKPPSFLKKLFTYPSSRPDRQLKIVWKYILFDHNDADHQLQKAQEMANDIGVDEMLFSLTPCWNRSKRYTSIEQLNSAPTFSFFNGKLLFDESHVREGVALVPANEEILLRDSGLKTNNLEVTLHDGWYESFFNSPPSRWIESSASITAAANYHSQCILNIGIMSFYRPRRCQILINGTQVFEAMIPPEIEMHALNISFVPGENTIQILSLDGAETPNSIQELKSSDIRPLAFSITTLDIMSPGDVASGLSPLSPSPLSLKHER